MQNINSVEQNHSLRAKLSHVGLRVADPESVAAYYTRVAGLVREPHDGGDAIRLGWGSGFHALELTRGDGFGHYGLELESAAAVEALADRLAAHGVDSARESCAGEHPPVLAFADADGHRIEVHGPVDRSGEHAADPGRRPVRVHHVTFASPSVADQVDFYERVLGFRVSDRMGDVFTWMRCNQEHHTVAVVAADEPALDHYAYEIGAWVDLKTWCDELAAHEVEVTWGPGRHGPGNNLFIMFDDPAGNRVELSCEMERYWDDAADYAPRRWEPGAKTINLWGPAPRWRDRVST